VEEDKLVSFMSDITSGGITKDGHTVMKQAQDKGLMHFTQIEKVDQSKDYLVQKEEHDTIAAKPRLRGIHRLRFQKYVDDKPVSEPVEIEIEGFPGDLKRKRKHYYIYSMTSNWGKSYNMDRLTFSS
jgi:hypothetical protein